MVHTRLMKFFFTKNHFKNQEQLRIKQKREQKKRLEKV